MTPFGALWVGGIALMIYLEFSNVTEIGWWWATILIWGPIALSCLWFWVINPIGQTIYDRRRKRSANDMTKRTEKEIDHCMRLLGAHPPGDERIREMFREGFTLSMVRKNLRIE